MQNEQRCTRKNLKEGGKAVTKRKAWGNVPQPPLLAGERHAGGCARGGEVRARRWVRARRRGGRRAAAPSRRRGAAGARAAARWQRRRAVEPHRGDIHSG